MLWWIPLSLAAPLDAPSGEPPAVPRIAVLLDTSRSIGADGLEAQRALLDAMGSAHPDATWAVMAVDAAADWIVQPYADEPTWPAPALRHGSSLGLGITLARAAKSPPTHVVAVTDGLLQQSVPFAALDAHGPPVHLVVLQADAVTHRAPGHPLAAMAPGGTVHVASRPEELASWLVRPTTAEPVGLDAPPPSQPTGPPGPDAEEAIGAAVDSVVDGCLKKPKHRSELGPITVETTRDEFVFLDLSAIDERYRWCLSGALFDLDLPPILRDVPRARVELDLRTR